MGISNNATFHHKGITLPISIRNGGNDPSKDEEGSPSVIHYNEEANSQLQREELDLLPEIREIARIREEALKRRMASRYNQKVVPRGFAENDLILIQNDIRTTRPGEGKLAANWKGPYRVIEVLGKGYYRLSELDGRELPRSWHASNLRRYYS